MSTQQTDIFSMFPQTSFFDLKLIRFKSAVNRVTNCWHLHMSRPFTHGIETYRSCLRCGMHRRFDLNTWKSSGPFYSPSVELGGGADLSLCVPTARKSRTDRLAPRLVTGGRPK